MAKFEDLVGKTLAYVSGTEGDERIMFVTTTGEKYEMFHSQDCCESVYVESIVGDLQDLVGTPILKAEESTSNLNPEDAKDKTIEWQDESFTWTFYKLATARGYVDIRWYGESNGYYSEDVDFRLVNNDD